MRLAQMDRAAGWVVIADRSLLERTARRLTLPLTLDDSVADPAVRAGALTVWHTAMAVPERPGQLDAANAAYVLATLERAADQALAGGFDGVVTGPVQKSIINEAGKPFTGHTEYFRDRAGAGDVVMLLVAGGLRVGLATTHLPLAAVPTAVTRELLVRRLEILVDGLAADFGLAAPKVLVAGLNPHAGEGGHLGSEEIGIISPVCEQFRSRGVDIVGPLPADTLFTPAYLEQADAVFAMYHDQGLPVLKHVGFGRAVNVTLGLPFVRTSVDHGTALDLAGRGSADIGSLAQALQLGARLGAARRDRAG